MPYADEQSRKLYQHLYYLKRKNKSQSKSIQSKSKPTEKCINLKKELKSPSTALKQSVKKYPPNGVISVKKYETDFTNDEYDEDEDEDEDADEDDEDEDDEVAEEVKHYDIPRATTTLDTKLRKYNFNKNLSTYYADDDDEDDEPFINDTPTKYQYYSGKSYETDPFNIINDTIDTPTFGNYIGELMPRYITKMPYEILVQRTIQLSNTLQSKFEDEIDDIIHTANRYFGIGKTKTKTQYLYYTLLQLVNRLKLRREL